MDSNIAGGSMYKVRLVSMIDARNRVVFEVTPTFSESRSVDYNAVTPVHMPGSVQVYKNTNGRSFSIGAHLVSRTPEEATQNITYLQQLRAWQLPYFGIGSATLVTSIVRTEEVTAARTSIDGSSSFDNATTSIDRIREDTTINVLGAPPDILYLYAYSNSEITQRTENMLVNINRVPVVLSSLEITYPEDVDYIPSQFNNEPFPVKMDVSISLLETHSPREFEQFSLSQYKAGALQNF